MNSYSVLMILFCIVWIENTFCQQVLPASLSVLNWRDINISLPRATSHQVIGYYPDADRVYLIGGNNADHEYWSLQFNESYNGWSRNEKLRFESLKIIEYTQSYFSSLHNIIYIKTNEYIHIFDMEIDYFNENVIKLPIHLSDGCITVYNDANDAYIEYLIIIGSKTRQNDGKPTTWIYKVDQKSHNITFFDIGPDLIGERENHCCAVMDNYLYVIGGVYANTRFVEQWLIDIDVEYNGYPDFDNFSNIDTLINTNIANTNLPQFGHRCIVNNDNIYVIGGITDQYEQYFNYSPYIFVLERKNNSLYEMNYRETESEGAILPSLPMEMAYTASMIDKYGYLNVFGGELSNQQRINKWFRISIQREIDDGHNQREMDVIWKNHRKHNHNEQWALLILLIMIIIIGLWFKCCAHINRLRSASFRNGSRGDYTDTAYDEITGTSEIDDLEETEDIISDSDNDNQIYSHLKGIIASDAEHNAEL